MPLPPLPPEHHRMAPDRLPTPFSAAQIADACRPGRVNEMLVSETDTPDLRYRWEFTGGDDEWGEYTWTSIEPGGAPLGEPAAGRDRWIDLQAHASYPAERTTIAVDTVDVPAGTFECWRYTLVDGDEVSHAWFAVDLPGPPVRKVDLVDGVEVSSMTLIAVTDPRR